MHFRMYYYKLHSPIGTEILLNGCGEENKKSKLRRGRQSGIIKLHCRRCTSGSRSSIKLKLSGVSFT